MLNQTNDARTLTSLRGIAVKGRKAEKRRDEVFASATMKGDDLVIIYKSRSRRQLSPRKWANYSHLRFVTCKRTFSPSHADFWWEGQKSYQTSYQD